MRQGPRRCLHGVRSSGTEAKDGTQHLGGTAVRLQLVHLLFQTLGLATSQADHLLVNAIAGISIDGVSFICQDYQRQRYGKRQLGGEIVSFW